jgi:hypothetical protein
MHESSFVCKYLICEKTTRQNGRDIICLDGDVYAAPFVVEDVKLAKSLLVLKTKQRIAKIECPANTMNIDKSKIKFICWID